MSSPLEGILHSCYAVMRFKETPSQGERGTCWLGATRLELAMQA